MTSKLANIIVYHNAMNSSRKTKIKAIMIYEIVHLLKPKLYNFIVLGLIGIIIILLNTNPVKSIITSTHYKVVYVPSPTISNDIKMFMSAISKFESSDNYKARRNNSQYLGRYQIGNAARTDIGLGGMNSESGYTEFLNNSELQDIAMFMLIKHNHRTLKEVINKYSNTKVGSYFVTESGIIAMAHNAGASAVLAFFASNGKIVAKDGNNKPMTDYLQFNNYKIDGLGN